MTTPLNLVARAKESATTTFTLKDAIGEAIGYASLCWSEIPQGTFDSDRAAAVAHDLQGAIAEFLRGAINAQGLDADLGMADWEAVEIILQTPRMGFDPIEYEADA